MSEPKNDTRTKTDVADPKVLLGHHLKKLKLPTILAEYDKQARQCAEQGIDYPQYLLRLVELELIERQRKMVERRIRAAKFPATKSLDSFDFKALPDRCPPRSPHASCPHSRNERHSYRLKQSKARKAQQDR